MNLSSPVIPAALPRLHNARRHAAVRTGDYVFSQLIPYIGNKRRLLHLLGQALDFTGVSAQGTFVDLFTGSTVVSRWAKRRGMRVIANDWEPYSQQIALGTVVPNTVPAFEQLGGAGRVFETLNGLPPTRGYFAAHLCPADDEQPDVCRERMFFTQANGRRIDAIGDQIDAWRSAGAIDEIERAYLMAAFIYAVSYASNTSGVFKGFHNGWGGKTGTALYRIRRDLTLTPPVLFDNAGRNIALRRDAQSLASELGDVCGDTPDVVYLDPPYNQHPYGSNYHVLNTVALWDKPAVHPSILVDGRKRDKSAIRKDWRTERHSPYNFRREALPAFRELLSRIQSRWLLVSYSSDGNIPLEDLVEAMASAGEVTVFIERYKRYRVSTPRMSPKSHNVEFVAVVRLGGKTEQARVTEIVETIRREDARECSTTKSQ